MKSFQITVWGVSLLFFGVLLGVTISSFLRKSNATHIDPATIRELREEIAKKSES